MLALGAEPTSGRRSADAAGCALGPPERPACPAGPCRATPHPAGCSSACLRWPRLGALGLGHATGIAAEPGQSLVVVGPTQSGKTTSLAVPAILNWAGPVLAASVKTDLLRDTHAARGARRGRVWRIDPTGCTGTAGDEWSPLGDCADWRRACRDDRPTCARRPRRDGTTADGEFWYATAAKLLAPLFHAAALDRRAMADVVRWVDTQEVGEVADVLERAGSPEALDAARATWCRDDRTRSSVYTTAETVLAPFAHSAPAGRRRRRPP